jgi:hypothetical protein
MRYNNKSCLFLLLFFFNFLSNFFTEKNKLKQLVESIEKEKDNLMTENNRLTEEGHRLVCID